MLISIPNADGDGGWLVPAGVVADIARQPGGPSVWSSRVHPFLVAPAMVDIPLVIDILPWWLEPIEAL